MLLFSNGWNVIIPAIVEKDRECPEDPGDWHWSVPLKEPPTTLALRTQPDYFRRNAVPDEIEIHLIDDPQPWRPRY
jgi:hypothetical protein